MTDLNKVFPKHLRFVSVESKSPTSGHIYLQGYRGQTSDLNIHQAAENKLSQTVTDTVNSFMNTLKLTAVNISPASPQEGDVSSSYGRCYMFINGAWRLIYPAAYVD